MTMMTWIATALKAAGCAVIELEGWQTKGRGPVRGEPVGVILHHTAGPRAPKGGDTPSLPVIVNGRPDLPGPLSQLYLARNGTFYVVAAGRTNHAGKGRWGDLTDGNDDFIGVEMENDGIGEPWSPVQLDAAVKGTAALLKHLKQPAARAIGHREWAPARKIDPAGIDLHKMRMAIAAAMAAPPN